ncbi:hypothetical protein CEXT_76841 [Caerostris extrusa]|uniref:Uncharacterized protein n=1 Tax=Caerostris extrusa TaxID=172846 RepID=A0AAV4PJ53_CAEEX|nr:hypothetical protein CEXT_76841 [Caerostris extrusa]
MLTKLMNFGQELSRKPSRVLPDCKQSVDFSMSGRELTRQRNPIPVGNCLGEMRLAGNEVSQVPQTPTSFAHRCKTQWKNHFRRKLSPGRSLIRSHYW